MTDIVDRLLSAAAHEVMEHSDLLKEAAAEIRKIRSDVRFLRSIAGPVGGQSFREIVTDPAYVPTIRVQHNKNNTCGND